MFKAIKLASGRFEIYEEDEQGNNVMTFPETYGTPEEANAKLDELNAGKPKVQDVIPPKTDEEAKPEEANAEADASKSDVEPGANSSGQENSGSEGGQEGGEGSGEGAGTGTGEGGESAGQ